jgi:hypothetical protein
MTLTPRAFLEILAAAPMKPGVYFAAVDGEGILLDVLADRYIGLSPVSAEIWAAVSAGERAEAIADRIAASRALAAPAARSLVDRQIEAWREAGLTGDSVAGRSNVPRHREPGAPGARGLDRGRLERTPVSAVPTVRVWNATRWAGQVLQRRGLAAALQEVQRIPASAREAEVESVYSMVRAEIALRRVFRQGTADCLIRSIGLAAAFRRSGVDAEICFGVRTYPFSAHAWVEIGGAVLTDEPANVRGFAVIARF